MEADGGLMEAILMVLAVAVPGVVAWLTHQRARRLEAQNDYLRKTTARRAKLEERKEVLRKEVAAAEAELAEKKEAAAAAESRELQVIEADAREKGVAAAAMEHLRRLKVVVALTAACLWSSSARAGECTEGYTLKAGQVLPCDGECLPAPSLMTLVKRSVALSTCEADAEAATAAFNRKVAALQAEVAAERQAREEAEEAAVGDVGASPTTVILIATVTFVLGAAAGAVGYHVAR